MSSRETLAYKVCGRKLTAVDHGLTENVCSKCYYKYRHYVQRSMVWEAKMAFALCELKAKRRACCFKARADGVSPLP